MVFRVVKYVERKTGDKTRKVVTSFAERWEADEFARSQLLTDPLRPIRQALGDVKVRYEVEEETAKLPKPKLFAEPHKALGQKPKKKRLTPAQQKRFVMQAGKCLACGNTDITILEVHHIKPFSKRGSNKPWNLSVLCPTCHRKSQNGHLTPAALVSKPIGRAGSPEAVHVKETPHEVKQVPGKTSHEVRVELADRVYTPLLKEVGTWNELSRAQFYEWKRLEQEQRMWTKMVPKPIVDLLEEAGYFFESRGKLWWTLTNMIENAIKEQAPTILGLDNVRDATNFQFYLSIEQGGYEPLYLLWIWESEKDLSNYIMDIVESRYPPGRKWTLETKATMLPSGTVKSVGETVETRELMNRVLSILMYQEPAREFNRNNQRIRDHAGKILALIDAELVKDYSSISA